MKSTDQNLNNPLRIGDIDLLREAESWRNPTVQLITQEEYDLLQTKDPLTIYVIHGSNPHRMYLGDCMIHEDSRSCKYLVGMDESKAYVLYMSIRDNGIDKIVPISRYKNPQDAIDAMNMCHNAGSHQKTNMVLFNSIAAFIDNHISVNDLVIGVLCIFGYERDPRLQNIIEVAISFGVKSSKLDIPVIFREELPSMGDRYENSLFDLYSDVYNIIVKYDFFKDERYHNSCDKLDLSSPIYDIMKAADKYANGI